MICISWISETICSWAMNAYEHVWNPRFFSRTRFDLHFRSLHVLCCYSSMQWTMCPGPLVSARQFETILPSIPHWRIVEFGLAILVHHFLHVHTMFHVIFFIFFFHSKIHISMIINPIELWFFSLCSSWSLEFNEYFSRNCALLDFYFA